MTRKAARRTQQTEECRLVAERLESVPDWIWELSLEGVVTYSNQIVHDLLGYVAEEATGVQIFDLMPEEDAAKCRGLLAEAVKTGEPIRNVVTRFRTKDASVKTVEVSCVPILRDGGKLEGFRGIGRDITESVTRQKIAEETESSYEAVVENSRTGIVIIQDQKVAYANPRVCEQMGYSRDEVVGTSIWKYVHPDEVRELAEAQRRRLAGEDVAADRVARAITKSGEIRHFDFRANVIQYKGAPAILLNALDITDTVHAQEALAKREQEFRDLVEKSSDWIWQVDENLVYTYSSPQSRDLLGYEPDEIVGKTPFDLMSPEEGERVSGLVAPMVEKREALKLFENTMLTKDGSLVVVETSGEPIFDAEGVFRGYRGADRDITERKKAEALLRKKTSEMETILHAFPDVYFWLDAQGRIINYHAVDPEELYTAPEQFLGKRFSEVLPEDAVREIDAAMNRIRETREPQTVEYPLEMRGEQFWFEARLLELPDEQIMVIVRNITERTRSALQLSESRQMLQLVMGNIPQFVFWKDRDSVYVGCNDNFARAAGLQSAAEIVGKTDYDLPWGETEADSYREWDRRVMESDEPQYHILEPQLTSAGEVIWVDTNKVPLHDAEGNVVGVLGTYEDITQRRQAQEALQEAEAKYRSLVEETMVGVYMIQDDQYIYANPRLLEILGAESEDVLGKSPLEFTAPLDRALVAENIRKRMLGEVKSIRYGYKALRKDGTPVDVEVHGAVTNFRGRPAIIGSMVDNTERKRYVEALQDSEERYRQLFEHSPDMLFLISGRTGTYIAMNPAVTQVLGYAPYDVLGKSPWDISPEFQPDGSNSQEAATALVQGQVGAPSRRFEWVHLRKDGTPVDCEVSLVGYRFHGEDLIQAIVRDITERKRAEENRLRLERELERQKRSFYRETILSVTDGTLDICDCSDIEPFIEAARQSVDVDENSQVGLARQKVEEFCLEHGLEGDRLNDYIVAVGEAATNAIKHGKHGKVCMGDDDRAVWTVVSDEGSGIESLILPRAVLLRGFSTKPSLGLGYSIMLEVCDRILLCTGKTGTTVVLIKDKAPHELDLGGEFLPDTWDSIPG